MFSLMPWRKERKGALAPRGESPFRLLRREFDTLFDQLFGRMPMGPWEEAEAEPAWGLTVEEKEKEVVVRAEMPGFEPADFDVRVTGDELLITAERKTPEPKEGEKKVEREFTRVQRTVTLPPFVDAEKVEATYRNGVLEVRFPKTAEAEGRRIDVKA